MELALLLIPMWVLATPLLVTIIEAGRVLEAASSTISGRIMLLQEQPITQFSVRMEAQSPGISTFPIFVSFLFYVLFYSRDTNLIGTTGRESGIRTWWKVAHCSGQSLVSFSVLCSFHVIFNLSSAY